MDYRIRYMGITFESILLCHISCNYSPFLIFVPTFSSRGAFPKKWNFLTFSTKKSQLRYQLRKSLNLLCDFSMHKHIPALWRIRPHSKILKLYPFYTLIKINISAIKDFSTECTSLQTLCVTRKVALPSHFLFPL